MSSGHAGGHVVVGRVVAQLLPKFLLTKTSSPLCWPTWHRLSLVWSHPDFASSPSPPDIALTQTLDVGGDMSWHTNTPGGGSAFDPPQLVSPVQGQSPTIHTTPRSSDGAPDRKRKRTLTASELDHSLHQHNPTDSPAGEGGGNGLAGSPTSQQNGNKARHQPGVKRACNDCRQQKVTRMR